VKAKGQKQKLELGRFLTWVPTTLLPATTLHMLASLDLTMEVSYLCFSYIKMIKTFTIMVSRLVKISRPNSDILVMRN